MTVPALGPIRVRTQINARFSVTVPPTTGLVGRRVLCTSGSRIASSRREEDAAFNVDSIAHVRTRTTIFSLRRFQQLTVDLFLAIVAAIYTMPLDAHSAEQNALLQEFHFGAKKIEDPPGSISPYVPCASGRIPAALRAARLGASDCIWDLGCGDGRLLHQAAAQHGCHCVGIEIVPQCIELAKSLAEEQQLTSLCQFAVCDLTALQPGTLRPEDGSPFAAMGDVCYSAVSEPLRSPTCVLLFITSHGLSRLKGWLREEWARGGLTIITCVERLDDCFDFEAEVSDASSIRVLTADCCC